MKFAICNLQFSLSAVKWAFQKIAGGNNRVKIRKRLLIEAEIKGRIYHPFCSPNIQKLQKGGGSNIFRRDLHFERNEDIFLKEISKNWKTRLSRLPKQELFDRNYYN